ncbi:MAG: serine/threonine protein kinase [Dorea sp.]|nr:serine/threonine protein kinase [Dorea sp.]
MELAKEYILSQYQEMGTLNENKNVRLVRNSITGKIAVKKIMDIEQKPVYVFLKAYKSDYIPEIYEYFEDDWQLIVIEEYIEGRNFCDILSERSFSPEEGCHIIKEICRALEPLHMATPPIVCRDLKPENIMSAPGNKVKLIDFDIARVVSPGKSRDTVVMGTEGYAVPEQFGYRQTDGRTDIYALGTILNCMILRKYPVEEIVKGKLGKVIRQCIAINPDERYQSVRDLEKALERIYPSVEKKRESCEKEGRYEDYFGRKTTGRDKKNWRTFLPPGFRSGTIWKMVLAVFGYLAVIDLSLSIEIKDDAAGTTEAGLGLLKILFLLSQLFEIGFIFNYGGWRDRISFLKTNNPLIKLVEYAVLEFILIVAVIILWIFISDLFY